MMMQKKKVMKFSACIRQFSTNEKGKCISFLSTKLNINQQIQQILAEKVSIDKDFSNPVKVIELKFKFAYPRKEINKDRKDPQDANTTSIDFSTMQFYLSIIRIPLSIVNPSSNTETNQLKDNRRTITHLCLTFTF